MVKCDSSSRLGTVQKYISWFRDWISDLEYWILDIKNGRYLAKYRNQQKHLLHHLVDEEDDDDDDEQ